MTMPSECKNAREFSRIMERIWDGDLHEHYDEYENAHTVARLYGKRLWPGTDRNGDKGGILFRFEDGSRAWVKTGAVDLSVNQAMKRGPNR